MNIFLKLFVVVASAAHGIGAAQIPPDFSQSSQPLNYIKITTQAERDFYWSGTKIIDDGVMEKFVPARYHGMPERFLTRALFFGGFSGRFHDEVKIEKMRRELPESGNRSNFMFDSDYGVAMLTIWRFQADGARIYVVEDLLNSSYGGVPAMISIGKTLDSVEATWAFTFNRDGITYEFYVPDKLDSAGKPRLNSEKVLRIVAGVLTH